MEEVKRLQDSLGTPIFIGTFESRLFAGAIHGNQLVAEFQVDRIFFHVRHEGRDVVRDAE
ncbi:hypothetical protein D3C81_1543020 [compost metagenome]